MAAKKIDHDAARDAAKRFIRGHFGNDGAKPEIRIPAQPDDDDILLLEYISQQEETLYDAADAAETALEDEGLPDDVVERVRVAIMSVGKDRQ